MNKTVADKEEFLNEILKVCKKYGYLIGHEDNQGALLIEPYTKEGEQWLLGAYCDYYKNKDIENGNTIT